MDSSREPRHPAASGRHLFPFGPDAPTPPDAFGQSTDSEPRTWPFDYEEPDEFARRQTDPFSRLIAVVGGADALWGLDASPLPDEPFDWSAVEPVDVPFVTEVLALSDRCCSELLDTEVGTIARRILSRVAARDPRVLRRSTKADRCAAGLVWLAGQANGEFGRRGRCSAQRLWVWFGVGSCADRGRGLRSAAGLDPELIDPYRWESDPLTVGDPALLHSRFRAGLIAQRDALLEIARGRRNWSMLDDGHTARFNAAPVKAVTAGKAVVAEGNRVMVLVGLGEHFDDASFFALSIPDARELVRMVQDALDAPPRRPSPS